MPLHSPDELKPSLLGATDLFINKFLETAQPPHLSQRAYQAAKKFTDQVSTKVARFCDTISKQTQFAEIHTFLQNLFTPPEVNIFTPETFPVWQNYIEALMQQIFSRIPEEDTHKETMRELSDFLSNTFPKTCWVDLCVTHLDSQYPQLPDAAYSVESARETLLLGYVHGPLARLIIPPTNFCCFLFNRIFSTLFTKDQLSWDRRTAKGFQENYLQVSDTIMRRLLNSSENPLHDQQLKTALIYLSHTSSDPLTLQSFLDSHSLFLFSPSFFYALFLNIPWAIRFLETALSIRDEGEPLKLTHEALAEWLARSGADASYLINCLQELLKKGKLELQLATPNLPQNILVNLLNFLLFNNNPIAALESTLPILRDHLDFLEAFERLPGTPIWAPGTINPFISSPVSDVFFAFIVSLHTQGHLNTALWLQIKNLSNIIRTDDAHDSIITYLQTLTKYKWRDSETINCLLSVVINAPVLHHLPLNTTERLHTIRRLNFILESDLFSHPEEVIELVSPGNPRNFPKNFEKDLMLDPLVAVMEILKISVSLETIKTIAGNLQKKAILHHISGELIRTQDYRSIKIVTEGIQHLHEIGIPFEEILSIFIERSFQNSTSPHQALIHFVMALNIPERHSINRPELLRNTIESFLGAPEASAEKSIYHTALLLSFALASKEKKPEMSPTAHVIHTLRSYVSLFQKVLDEMSQHMSDEEKGALKKRLYALFARVIQQEKLSSQLLRQEADMVASAAKLLAEAPRPPGDGGEPLPSSLLREGVYEHSLLLFRKAANQSAPPPSEEETKALFANFVEGPSV